MASTLVRIYDLRPDDIEVRDVGQVVPEFAVHLGDTVAVQGSIGQLRALFSLVVHRIDETDAVKSTGEPF